MFILNLILVCSFCYKQLFCSFSWLRNFIVGFPRWLCSKESTCQAGHMDSIPGSGRSLEKEMTPHSSILPGKSHGKRSLAGPWIPKSQTPLSDYRTTTISLYISNTFYSFLCQITFPFAVKQTLNQPNTDKNLKKSKKKKKPNKILY